MAPWPLGTALPEAWLLTATASEPGSHLLFAGLVRGAQRNGTGTLLFLKLVILSGEEPACLTGDCTPHSALSLRASPYPTDSSPQAAAPGLLVLRESLSFRSPPPPPPRAS